MNKGLSLGALDYIRKPINMESLKVRIDMHSELLYTTGIRGTAA